MVAAVGHERSNLDGHIAYQWNGHHDGGDGSCCGMVWKLRVKETDKKVKQ
jgi:hypothetical protein